MSKEMDAKSWAILLLTAGLFGSSFFFIKLTVVSIPPISLAAGRSLIAAIIVYGFMRASGNRLPEWGRAWRPLIILGILTAAIPYAAIAWAQQRIDSSLGGILFATIPVFSVIFAPFLLPEEQHSGDRLLGVGIGFGGVVLVVGSQAFGGSGDLSIGAAATLLAALSYAVGNIYARRLTQFSPVVMAAGQLSTASVLLVPLSIMSNAPWTISPTATALVGLVVVAVFSTAAPVLLMFWLIRTAGATNTSLLAFFIPAAAVIPGVVILGERLSGAAVGGFVIILVSAAIVTGHIPLSASKRTRK